MYAKTDEYLHVYDCYSNLEVVVYKSVASVVTDSPCKDKRITAITMPCDGLHLKTDGMAHHHDTPNKVTNACYWAIPLFTIQKSCGLWLCT